MVDSVHMARALALVLRYSAGGSVVCWHTGGPFDAGTAEAGP